MPTRNARLDTVTATAASVRCASVMHTATSATRIATGARRPGARARATAESASENAQRNPATLSALECTAASIKRSSLARPEQSDQKVESGANGPPQDDGDVDERELEDDEHEYGFPHRDGHVAGQSNRTISRAASRRVLTEAPQRR